MNIQNQKSVLKSLGNFPLLNEKSLKKFLYMFSDYYMLKSENMKSESLNFIRCNVNGDVKLTPKINNRTPLKEKHFDERWEYEFPIRDAYVADVGKAHLLGKYALPVMNSGEIIEEAVHWSQEDHDDLIYRELSYTLKNSPKLAKNVMKGFGTESLKQTIDTAALLYNQWTGYFHWMLEHLMKIKFIEQYKAKKRTEIKLIIPPDPSPYMIESLNNLGYSEDDYIIWNGVDTTIENFIVPSYPEPKINNIEWLRGRMIKSKDHGESPDSIYISRQRANHRRVDNYKQVEELLDKFNIQPICCEELSLQTQINIFNNADLVLGPHGAGLTNMIWGDNLSVIEIFNDVLQPPYYVIAEIMGHDYTAIPSSEVANSGQKRNYDMNVDIGKLEKQLVRYFN